MAKYKMADDFDDGDKGKGKEKDKVSLDLFKSVIEYMISDISSQLYSTNPAELARINNIINSLLSSDLPPEIQTRLKKLQELVVEKEENAEQVRNSGILERNREEATKWEEHVAILEKEAERLEAERLLAQFHQEGSMLTKQHEKFKVDIVERIKETKEETIKHNELFDYLSDENLKGKDIDESKLRPFIKNKEQIERELYRHQKAAHKHYDELCAYDAKLKAEKEELKEAVKKQPKPKELQSSILLETANYIDSEKKLLKTANNLYDYAVIQIGKTEIVQEKYGLPRAAEFYKTISSDLHEALLFGKAEAAAALAYFHRDGLG
ncbi:hypothetical protein [Candidatus Tisiphia endosymbiont of Micropterix aruncella]|uniref:hypothetical protein n=1 Tax=Candidatus Tisiphia endosymbiont of Micropterix aruncella TaxID=3066271 RepID=UPI003AA8017D